MITMASAPPALATPSRCTADFSLIPVKNTPPKNDLIESLSSIPIKDRLSYASFSQQIADIQRLIQQSGLKYVMHATGTTLEGTWDEVSQLIGFAHTLIHQEGIARVQTDIRIQTRTDKIQPIEGHISSVEAILSASAS
ncbi:uncharacterized protein N7443_008803 [Penicillium atrosanguineum]|uniref:uncharacterized protein n=1 Tax=Penicillium atrosanguineum TaxID=1132637 RepID=UPI00238CDDF0|nr:uncharacterized protein N7443_008803 [Penicillium atrosanguineum]KAJ5292850.1 hypothetical protein N7443_008803 [Penicillium atrosanguineum]